MTEPAEHADQLQQTTSEIGWSESWPVIDDAATAIFVLRDYSKFGLAERVCYHFDLTESLSATEPSSSESSPPLNRGPTNGDAQVDDLKNDDNGFYPPIPVCGVYRLLECAPMVLWHRFNRRQKRTLKNQIREFNSASEKVYKEGAVLCYEPQELPLRCIPSTRVFFGYEVTRIAFCVDASASLTSTFGIVGSSSINSGPLCPLDRLPEMAKLFFSSLVEPISSASLSESWIPRLAVTVLAVYPMGATSETDLLVRDFQVYDSETARVLTDQMEAWLLSDVEFGISERRCRRQAGNAWSDPIYSSNLRHILEAADYALDVLSSEARPVIVVATDGRSVSCDGIVDVFLDVDRVDIPVHVLDLSFPETHFVDGSTIDHGFHPSRDAVNFLIYDPGGPLGFPLHLTDDTESLFIVCRATGGCFLDLHLLSEAAKNTAGHQLATDVPSQQAHSFRRRFVKMNGLQWLTLFSLSPLSPTFHASLGKLIPPLYLQKRLTRSMTENGATTIPASSDYLDGSRHPVGNGRDTSGESNRIHKSESFAALSNRRQHTQARTTFSTYIVSPVRIKALLLTRIKEGYRTKQYLLSTHDTDKVFIQFSLPVEFGTVLHYELSYKALSSENHMVGSAHIKVELSGDPGFVHQVKKDFLRPAIHASEGRLISVRQKKSARLCQVFRCTRTEDILQSYLKPPHQWSDQFASPDSPFVKRLASLTKIQRKRHFQTDEFDVVCSGPVPYGIDNSFLSDFLCNEDGKQELVNATTEWSSQVMKSGSKYVKRCSPDRIQLTNYCVVEILESSKASQLFTLGIEFFGGTSPLERLQTLSSLKKVLDALKYVEVLRKQMAPFLIGDTKSSLVQYQRAEIQFHHARWDLLKDPELLSLLTRRRIEIGSFRLLQSSDNYGVFAKLVPEDGASPGDLVQYQIEVRDDKVVIDLHMESESGVFNPYRDSVGETTKFSRMANIIRRRDQECARALSSRTNLLNVFYKARGGNLPEEDHRSSVKRMLAYSSPVSRKLRFFRSSDGVANEILFQLTSELLLSKGFSNAKVARLDIEPYDPISGEDPGVWFLIRYDRLTMSVVHLSLVDKDDNVDGQNVVRRELTFFTAGISDLYSKRDDLADDDSAESHISEYMCVTQFADHFEAAEEKNYALAAYLALRQSDSKASIDPGDFKEVIRPLQFVEVSSVFVVGGPSDSTEDSKLFRCIKTIVSPVPNVPNLFFCSGDPRIGIRTIDDNNSLGSSEDGESTFSSETEGDAASNVEDLDCADEERGQAEEGNGDISQNEDTLYPPIFVKFKLDGVEASLQDLNWKEKSSNLSVEISLFKENKRSLNRTVKELNLNWIQQAFSVEITSVLKSYVAEQTLERLRNGPNSEDNLLMVKKCLARIRTVVTFSIDVTFYISKRDAMAPASAPAGGEVEVDEGFHILDGEMRSSRSVTLKAVSAGCYFVCSIPGEEKAMEFWCLLTIHRNSGTISSQTYHPEGEAAAMAVTSKIHDFLSSCVHRVNQQLLLKSMHRHRIASELLIPNENKQEEGSILSDQNESNQSFTPGIFSCPTVFRTSFDLYHRAATNPGQVARTLEATVLHSFAVSNRSGIFVYKDETEAIFYMKIEPRGSGIDADGKVELLVFGVHEPGPSLTEQLRVLLQRRLLLIGVDMLSSVLTKNPHFKWKQADFDFLRSFDKEWQMLEDGKIDKPEIQIYEFPVGVTDPCMVLIMFRQNLCGSTFFHRLNDIDHNGSNPSPAISESTTLAAGGSTLNMNRHEFTVYYNNAPSKLDPKFQGLSTLTDKGAEFCRQAGMGIAMIEFGLVYGDGQFVDEVEFAVPASPANGVDVVPLENLRMKKRTDFGNRETNAICVQVKITDTSLQRTPLHEWILLTLNQALVEWVAERLVERSIHGLLRPINRLDSQTLEGTKIDSKREILVDGLCPGLPAMKSVLESSFFLPHPAIGKVEHAGVIRSSSVATLTLTLLEKCILLPVTEKKLPTMFDDEVKVTSSPAQEYPRNLKVVRISRSERPRLVHLTWSMDRRTAVVSVASEDGTTKQIKDSPIDCPEYICYFLLTDLDGDIEGIDAQLRLYKEVVVDDGISEKSRSIDLLQSIKKSNSEAFARSFAFVFSVKRNKRCLWTYNWNPQIVRSVSAFLREADASNLAVAGRISHSLQHKSLRTLSPGFVDNKVDKQVKTTAAQLPPKPESKPEASEKQKKLEHSSDSTPPRRIRRPTMIRRPKLIGQSIEGAAMQAVAASRKRASTNQFKNKTSPKPIRPPITRDATLSRPGLTSSVELGSDRDLTKSNRSLDQNDEVDEILTLVMADSVRLCSTDYGQLRRLSSLHTEGRIRLTDLWWPRSLTQSIPLSVANYLISSAPKGWTDVCSFPPLPGGVENVFIPTMARWIVALTPGFAFLSVSSATDGLEPNSLLLCSSIKNVRGSKCFAVVRIATTSNTKRSRLHVPFVSCEGWVLNLPRRSRTAQKAKPNAAMKATSVMERDSAGMDKTLTDVHRSLVLESLLFDFSASMVERAVRLLDERIKFEDLVPTIEELMRRYPYERQKRMPMLNYRAFKATIVLKSYRDRLIDLYDANALFQRLDVDADGRELLRCGDSLCFKKSIISVKGSHSMCFLAKHPTEGDRMELIILCRTQGRNLSDFMFREDSNVAIHILDNIAIDAAGLALKELHYAAECLFMERLWKSLSSRRARTSPSTRQTIREDLQELMRLACIHPLYQLHSNGAIPITIPHEIQFLLGPDSGIEWNICCTAMKRNKSFSPNWSIDDESTTKNLFYIEKYDVFLMLVLDENHSLLRSAEIIEKGKADNGKHHVVFDILVNFTLHFVWNTL